MGFDLSIKVGGEAGQGIQTVGDIIAAVCGSAGMYLMAINDFESRVRGGHSFFQIRISDTCVNAPSLEISLLLALNKRTYELHKGEMTDGGMILGDSEIFSEDKDVTCVPANDLAAKAGGKIFSNTVMAGACLSLLGAPFEVFRKVLTERFKSKGSDIVEKNVTAARLGYDAVEDTDFRLAPEWTSLDSKGMIINGAQAVALGALAGDCRLAAFYPMSPATSVMRYLTGMAEDFPIIVEQVEDEIAAVNMITGASFAGVRAMTSTSGGGFCLMVEGLGLAGITETPIVIVNAQRPGPATGLPTRTAQGDLQFVINASQDEFPRFVFAPGTPEEAFQLTIKAFHLSQKYQVPAIILTDQHLHDSLFIADRGAFNIPREIERFIINDSDMENPAEYKRFAFASNGISPRALPCMGKAIVRATGNEHTEDGHISEDAENRFKMVNKRNAKISRMVSELNPPEALYADSRIILAEWGSPKGAVRESVDIMRDDGLDVGCLHFSELWPFPAEEVRKMLKGKDIITVEQNSTSQLSRLITEQTGIFSKGSVLRYDGRPFYPEDIAEEIKTNME